MREGDLFATLEELEEKIKEYEENNFTTLHKRVACLLSEAAKKYPRAAKGKSDLKYYFIEYACSKWGKRFKSRGKAIRKTTTIYAGCQMEIQIILTEDGQHLRCKLIQEQHNHENNEELLFESIPYPSTQSFLQPSPQVSSSSSPLKQIEKEDLQHEILTMVKDRFRKPDTEYQVMAKNWAFKLERMSAEQRRLAEKFISEILFEGEEGNLHRHSVVINSSVNSSRQYSSRSNPFPTIQSPSL